MNRLFIAEASLQSGRIIPRNHFPDNPISHENLSNGTELFSVEFFSLFPENAVNEPPTWKQFVHNEYSENIFHVLPLALTSSESRNITRPLGLDEAGRLEWDLE